MALVHAAKSFARPSRAVRSTCSYETSCSKLLDKGPRLRDYAKGTVRMISYQCIRQANISAAKFLQLWTSLNHQDMWYERRSCGKHSLYEHFWLKHPVQSEISCLRKSSGAIYNVGDLYADQGELAEAERIVGSQSYISR